MQSADGSFCLCLSFSFAFPVCINPERNPDHKGSSCAFFTFKGNGSTHFLDQILCNRHSKSCSGKFCAASCVFLCKWFKNMFLELLSHSDSGIPADKFHCGHSWLSGWDFHAADIDMSVFSVIFHRIGQDIHHHPFHIPRTSNKIPVCDFFFLPLDPDILFCSHLLDHSKYFP